MKKKKVDLCESYVVKFWIKEGDYWEQQSKLYWSTCKGDHYNIEKKWEAEYKDREVKIINVVFQ